MAAGADDQEFDPIKEILNILHPYQKDLLRLLFDHNMVITVKSRQIGASFICALWAVLSRLETKNRKLLVMSRDIESAKGFIFYCKQWLNAINALFSEEVNDAEADSTIISLKFNNGSQIIARSSNPAAPRSFSGDILCDEFSFMERQEEMYASALSVTDEGGKFIIVSTFNGIGNTYYDLVEKTRRGETKFKLFECDIVKAVTQGLADRRPGDHKLLPPGKERNEAYLQFMESRCLNKSQWLQEYMCMPISTESIISPELFDRQATSTVCTSLYDIKRPLGDLYVGIDIGRMSDPTTIVVLEHVIDPTAKDESQQDIFLTILVKSLYQTEYETQLTVFRNILNHKNITCCQVDNNGIGGPIFETLKNEFPGIVNPTSFNVDRKAEMYEYLVGMLETDRLALARNQDADYKAQFCAIKRIQTKTNKTSYDGRTKFSHCDSFVSTAMALYGYKSKFSGSKAYVSNIN